MYDKKITSNDPSLIIVLIDQSTSMSDVMVRNKETGETFPVSTMAKYVCDHFLYEIFSKCVQGEEFKPYLDLAVIGYGQGIRSALTKITLEEFPFKIAQLADAITKKNKKSQENTKPNFLELPRWEWVEERANGDTPMLQAFSKSREIIEKWLPSHQDSFPPMIINMSDGAPTDDPKILAMLYEGVIGDVDDTQLLQETKTIQKLGTKNGTCLICNVNIKAGIVNQIEYPAELSETEGGLAHLMYQMSSVIPDTLRKLAQSLKIDLDYNARFFVFNADVNSLKKFFKFGTAVSNALTSDNNVPEDSDNNEPEDSDNNEPEDSK